MRCPFLLILCLFLFIPQTALAFYDPLSVPNNRLGIHVLHPDEIETAAKLVNNDQKSSWGYITVPIQAGDRNRPKWIRFMEQARNQKIIPIIRIATFANGPNWAEPNNYDLTDFANFLNDLPWPTKNRYVVIFNEVNRADEYGGFINPENYADILTNAVTVFKTRSENFFILPAGLDNAAANSNNSLNWSTYLNRMHAHQPEIFNLIDGWTSHAYPNPGFSASPLLSGSNKINSFLSDLAYIKKFTNKNLPVFITETGWSNQNLVEDRIANYYELAFSRVWNHPNIVAVTPFLLQASTPPFNQFSLLKDNHPTAAFLTLQSLAIKGEPELEPLPTPTPAKIISVPTLQSDPPSPPQLNFDAFKKIYSLIINFFTTNSHFTQEISVGSKTFQVELAQTDESRSIGLSKYLSLLPNQGMLFIFEESGNYPFWMKNMVFDIDIVWISDNQVIGISQGNHQEPETLINPPAAVNMVLEVNSGSGIKIGDKIIFNDQT